MIFNQRQREAIDLVTNNQHLFLTGEAGTGKSFLLKHIIEILSKKGKNVAVTATTGIASVNINGITIHSWCDLFKYEQIRTCKSDHLTHQLSKKVQKRINSTDYLIIDEISMFDKYYFDLMIECILEYRKQETPIVFIFSGDFYQLPPVNNDDFNYCFNSRYWKLLFSRENTVILYDIYRQNDTLYQSILSNIRIGYIKDDEIQIINQRVIQNQDMIYNQDYLLITCYKQDAENINSMKLDQLNSKSYYFSKKIKQYKRGDYSSIFEYIEDEIELKIGAKVMISRNLDFKKSLVNGTRGTVIDIKDNQVLISVNNKKEWIKPIDYKYTENGRVVAKCTQIPLKLCWSLTIHKCQSITIDKCIIDMTSIFSYGQCYVALSRIKSLDGLYLIRPIDDPRMYFKTSSEVDRYYSEISDIYKERLIERDEYYNTMMEISDSIEDERDRYNEIDIEIDNYNELNDYNNIDIEIDNYNELNDYNNIEDYNYNDKYNYQENNRYNYQENNRYQEYNEYSNKYQYNDRYNNRYNYKKNRYDRYQNRYKNRYNYRKDYTYSSDESDYSYDIY